MQIIMIKGKVTKGEGEKKNEPVCSLVTEKENRNATISNERENETICSNDDQEILNESTRNIWCRY